MKIKLYHGTSVSKLGDLVRNGFVAADEGAILTHDLATAEYHAALASKADTCNPKVMVVEVDSDNLLPDDGAILEAINAQRDESFFIASKGHQAINFSENSWQYSLMFAKSACHPEMIMANQVDLADFAGEGVLTVGELEKINNGPAPASAGNPVWLATFETPNTQSYAIGYTPEDALSAMIAHWKKMSALHGGSSDAILEFQDSVEIAPIMPGTGIGVGISDELWPKDAMIGDDPRFSDIWNAEFNEKQDQGLEP